VSNHLYELHFKPKSQGGNYYQETNTNISREEKNTNYLHQYPALQFYICIVYPYTLLVLTIKKNNIAIKQLNWTMKMKLLYSLRALMQKSAFAWKSNIPHWTMYF